MKLMMIGISVLFWIPSLALARPEDEVATRTRAENTTLFDLFYNSHRPKTLPDHSGTIDEDLKKQIRSRLQHEFRSRPPSLIYKNSGSLTEANYQELVRFAVDQFLDRTTEIIFSQIREGENKTPKYVLLSDLYRVSPIFAQIDSFFKSKSGYPYASPKSIAIKVIETPQDDLIDGGRANNPYFVQPIKLRNEIIGILDFTEITLTVRQKFLGYRFTVDIYATSTEAVTRIQARAVHELQHVFDLSRDLKVMFLEFMRYFQRVIGEQDLNTRRNEYLNSPFERSAFHAQAAFGLFLVNSNPALASTGVDINMEPAMTSAWNSKDVPSRQRKLTGPLGLMSHEMCQILFDRLW